MVKIWLCLIFISMQVIAFGIAIGTGLHAISHLACDFPRLLHAKNVEYEPVKRFFGDERPDNYGWFMKGTDGWTGVTMVVLMVVAYVLAQSWFRRNRANLPKSLKRLTGFNAFWYSHHLFVIVYVLLIVHGYFIYLSKEWYHKTVRIYTYILSCVLINHGNFQKIRKIIIVFLMKVSFVIITYI